MLDLYDFNYPKNAAQRWGAIVQAGHGTLGNKTGGWIFRCQVNLNTPVFSMVPYNLD